MEFRREAGRIIQDALENKLSELAAALKMDEDELRDETRPYTTPYNLTEPFDGSGAEIDLRIPKDWNSKWQLWFFVWIGDGGEPYFAAQVSFKKPSAAIDKLAAVCKDLDYDETYARISEAVPSDGSRNLAAICDRVLNRWIALWKKVGGLRQFISKRG